MRKVEGFAEEDKSNFGTKTAKPRGETAYV